MGKLLFISPPPSPPCGWEIREEDPPNKEIIAADLARALAGLGGDGNGDGNGHGYGGEGFSPMSEEEREELTGLKGRGRSGSLVYHPGLHGVREDLPAVMVVDTEEGEEGGEGRGVEMTKTARPPVELMEGV